MIALLNNMNMLMTNPLTSTNMLINDNNKQYTRLKILLLALRVQRTVRWRMSGRQQFCLGVPQKPWRIQGDVVDAVAVKDEGCTGRLDFRRSAPAGHGGLGVYDYRLKSKKSRAWVDY